MSDGKTIQCNYSGNYNIAVNQIPTGGSNKLITASSRVIKNATQVVAGGQLCSTAQNVMNCYHSYDASSVLLNAGDTLQLQFDQQSTYNLSNDPLWNGNIVIASV